jgi:hypothetical protein
MRPLFTACALVATAATLSACASEGPTSGRYYSRGDSYVESCSSNGDQVAGAVVGGGIGALAGSAIAGRGNRTGGAVLGGVAGAVVGAEVAKSTGRAKPPPPAAAPLNGTTPLEEATFHGRVLLCRPVSASRLSKALRRSRI